MYRLDVTPRFSDPRKWLSSPLQVGDGGGVLTSALRPVFREFFFQGS